MSLEFCNVHDYYLGVVLVIVFIWLMSRQLYHRNVRREEFEKFIRSLLTQGGDRSLMFIDHQRSVRFVQFAKYRPNESRTILHFGFPDAPWSQQYFNAVVKGIEELRIDYEIIPGEGPVQRFLNIDVTTDDQESAVSVGARIARAAFEAMGLNEGERFKIYYKGELSPDAARPAAEALSAHPNRVARALSRYYLKRSDARKRRDR